MLKALHGTGTVLIEDLTGGRPRVSQKLIPTKYPQGLADLQVLLEAIALVEERAGVDLGVPEVITAQEANDLTLVSAYIREGGQDLTFKSAEFLAAPDSPLLQSDPITEVRIEQHLDARVFGRIVNLGKTVCEMPPLRIISRMPAPEEGDGYQLLIVAPASGGPVMVRAVLQSLGED
jgi:hypothetical protein